MNNISHAKNINDSVLCHIFSGSANIDLEATLYLCPDRICEQCGDDHDLLSRASFDDVKTSIDNIPALHVEERTMQGNLVTRKRNGADIVE
jgi:hypothetical protein